MGPTLKYYIKKAVIEWGWLPSGGDNRMPAFVPAPNVHQTQSLRPSTNRKCQMLMFSKEQGTTDSAHQGYQLKITDEWCHALEVSV